jgi:N-acetylneuraminic acid mutarotase
VRQEHAVVALDGEVYVIGGFTPSATATNAAYDPGTGMWRAIADFPVVFHHANAAAIGGKLYVTGFHLGTSFTDADERVFEYDPVDDDWMPKTSMPAGTERGASCIAVLDSLIYVFGGAAAATVATSSAYDPVLDEWQPLPPLPEPREHCVAGAIGGKVYIAAGRSGGITGFQPSTWAYDPAAREYEPLAPIRTPRGGAAGAVHGGRLLVFGGEGNPDLQSSGVFQTVEAYDPSTNSWDPLPDMLVPRHGFGAAVVGDRVYLPGGATSQGFGPVAVHTEVYFE